MPATEIILKTNHNNKLYCNFFVHIQLPWEEGINEKVLLRISTKDGSYPPFEAVVYDGVKQTLSDLAAPYIYLSHGMDKIAFKAMLQKEAPSIKADSVLAAYFFKKVNSKQE